MPPERDYYSYGGDEGGGIYSWNSETSIDNCTILGNIFCGVYCESGSTDITNSIIYSGSDEFYYNYYVQAIDGGRRSEITVAHSNIRFLFSYPPRPSPGVGNINVDPCFVNPGYWDANGTAWPDDTDWPWKDDFWVDGDYRLLPDSACINAGEPNYIPEANEADIDGNARVIGGRIDIGAYEFAEPAFWLDSLVQDVIDLELQKGTENSLLSKLDGALRKLEDDNENNDDAAVNLLQAFISTVEAQSGKKIPEADADVLIEAALEIIELLGDE